MERSSLRFEYFFLIKGVKLPRKISLIFNEFCLTSRIVFGIGATIRMSRDALSPVCGIFIESAHWASGPIRSSSRNVRVFVCLSVCVFDVPFHEAYFAPTSRSRMFQIVRDSESLGKSAGKKWSQNWNFLSRCGLKSPRKKKLCLLILLYKTWWKPRFPMD